MPPTAPRLGDEGKTQTIQNIEREPAKCLMGERQLSCANCRPTEVGDV